MARDSYGRICRAGVLAVSPPDYAEMPDEYLTKARAELLSDNAWLAEQIAADAKFNAQFTAAMLADEVSA